MGLDPDRLQAAVAACAGAICWGLFHFATTVLAGQPVSRGDVLRASANVVFGIIVGVLAGYFIVPALAELIPWASMRDPHVSGFAVGAGAWISWPFLKSGIERWAGKTSKKLGDSSQ